MNPRILVIANPIAGRGLAKKVVKFIEEQFKSKKFFNNSIQEIIFSPSLEILLTTKKNDAIKLAAKAEKNDIIMSVGGDGTLNEVINGIVTKHKSDVLICPVPLGTSNVYTEKLSIPKDPFQCIISLLNHKYKIQEFNLFKLKINGNERLFFLMLGVGFDAAVVKLTHSNRQGAVPYTTYFSKAVQLYLSSYLPQRFRLEIDNQKIIENVSFCVLSDSTAYGGPFKFFPDAIPNDTISCIIYKNLPKTHLLKVWLSAFIRKHFPSSNLPEKVINSKLISGKYYRILPANDKHKIPIQIDGEYVGYLPCEVSISEEKARFTIPV